jgi:putative urate catabolism protein
MMDETYPRDMIGYGRTPPFADWPKRARIAVQFVVNYEEGGENNILHGDAASEAFLSEIVGAAPWPGMRHMNMESIYEYGSRAGFWRLYRLFTERSVPVTVYAVATGMARNREAVAAMNEARWEIATHGLKWVDYRDTPPEIEALHIAEAVRIHTEIAGARPLGFYQGRSSINTIRLGMEEGGFVYCADTYADDLPYWLEGPRGPQLMTPYTLDANDMRFATAQGFNTGDQFYTYLKDSFDTLYAEGDVVPKMMSIGLHCRLVGRPGRALALARGSLTMPLPMIASGFQPGSTSPGTGSPSTRRLAAGSPLSSPARCLSNASAACTSIRLGSRRLGMIPVCRLAPTRRMG